MLRLVNYIYTKDNVCSYLYCNIDWCDMFFAYYQILRV